MTPSKMSFGVSQVRDFLKKNGYVLTVRGYDYRTTSATVPDLDNIPITRKKVCEIKAIDELKGFLPLSSFADVRDWWKQIKNFCNGKMYLYLVKIDDTHISKMEKDAERIEQTRQDNITNAADREFIVEHPYDIRNDPGMRDPALVDLQPYKEAAHNDRLQREARTAERRRDAMRKRAGEQQGQGRIKKIIPSKKQDILMITGNRKLKNPDKTRRELEKLIDSRKPDIAISGMAIGTDQLFACICIEKGIPIRAYIPFIGQENRWPMRVQKRYKSLLQRCDEKVIVCDSASIAAYQKRNAAMVAASSRAIAVWDRERGGTKNCIRLLDRDSVPYTVLENGA